MNQVMIDLWPLIVPVFLGAIVYQWRENHQLKIRVAVLENTVENLEATLTNIQKRQDSQSKKQDDILDRIGAMEKEVLKQVAGVQTSFSKQISDVSSTVASLAGDVKGLSNLILVSDKGIKIDRQN